MGDGSIAFAPQWLKAGHTSLRTGTQGGAPSSKEDGSKGLSWRESGSGSRLGLGAGADRELTEPKLSGNQSRRQGGASYTDRSSGSHRGDRTLGARGTAQGRLLSDRELVEQTSSLKVRPGRSNGNFGGAKESATPRGASKINSRKPNFTGPQRSSNGRGPDRELIGSNRPQNGSQHLSATSALLSPRQELALASGSMPITLSPGGSGQWTTKLADTPHEVPRSAPTLAQLANVTAQASSHGSNGVRATSPLETGALPSTGAFADAVTPKGTPRMADAIASAQANAASELEAAKLEKQRKEQLALRQSKQLIPVLASSAKSKQTLGTLTPLASTASPGPTLLKRPTVSDGPKPGVSAFTTTRGDESANGMKRAQNSTAVKAPTVDPSSAAGAPKSFPSRPSRDKGRLKFFSSLKSKSNLETRTASDASTQPSQGTATSVNTTSTENGQLKSTKDSKGTAHPEMTAKEIAFMRSLGWDGDLLDDGTEGGLTEEEIAAFHANYSRQKKSTPVHIPQKGPQSFDKNTTGVFEESNDASKKKLACSFHSEMEFSDSDAE